MSTSPPPPPPPPPPEPKRGPGIAAGIVLTLVLIVLGAVAGASLTVPAAIFALPALLVVVSWLILRDRLPGYGLGVAWGLGIAAATFTGCTILVITALGN